MVVARASGMDLASILKRNTFLTLEVRPAGGPGSARDGGTEKGPGTGGHKRAPGRGAAQGPDTVLWQPSRRKKIVGRFLFFSVCRKQITGHKQNCGFDARGWGFPEVTG